jgi:hypothetical protein
MFAYPLPLDFNPYQPATQGYNNLEGVNHYRPFNPIAGSADGHININDGTGDFLDVEYEPIGFYTQKVLNRNRSLAPGIDRRDVGMQDRRTITVVDPANDLNPGTGQLRDGYRSGVQEQADKYAIYGRRTIILDVLPSPSDTDGDQYAADDDRDGGATAIDPYPLAKGPDNKFQVVSRYGSRGKLVIVQVFWLPRNPPAGYVAAGDLNKIELKTFIAASNTGTEDEDDSGDLTSNDYLFITPDN